MSEYVATGANTGMERTPEPEPEALPPEALPPRAPAAARSSLRGRMKARQGELEQRTTEIFPVPRWETILAVELRAVGWDTTEAIVERYQAKTSVLLPTAAEEIAEATVAFYEVKDDDSLELVEGADSWSAIAAGIAELPDAPPMTSERVAMIELMTDQGVMSLSATYRRWLGGANVGIGKELRRDFGTTP